MENLGKNRKGTLSQVLLISLSVIFSLNLANADQPEDHHKIKGPNACSECHEKSAEIWQHSHHFQTFTKMPRSKEARAIADKLGIKRIKAQSLCLGCHFTQQREAPTSKPEVIAGISCESCHGPAADWLERHSEFSGKEEEQETQEEEARRWADAEGKGMIRPNMTYTLAKNCYSCHITPNEELVNKGGHPAGSAFELLTWSQGEVRHTVWHSKGGENREASAERKRVLFIVGAAVELESSVRAVGAATKKDKYAITMAKRAKLAAKRMAAISKVVSTPELKAIIAEVRTLKLSLNNSVALNKAADTIGRHAAEFAANHDGTQFSAIDKILPKPSKYKGRVQP